MFTLISATDITTIRNVKNAMKTLKKILLGLTILIMGFIIGSQVVVHLWKKQNSKIERLIL